MAEEVVELWRDAGAALRLFTISSPQSPPDRHRLARAAVLFPAVGTLIGGGLAACNFVVSGLVSEPVQAILVVLVWASLSRGMSLRALASAVVVGRVRTGARTLVELLAIATVAASKAVALTLIGPALLAHVLVIAPILGRWALVVLAYGARPIRGGSCTVLQLSRVTFREFGWSSVLAFAIALSLADAVGLIFVIVAAVTATGIRLGAYARSGEMSSDVLGAGIEIVELAVLAAAALLSTMAAPG
jgi:adenosylcobinamide-GDP ribazoletransferase